MEEKMKKKWIGVIVVLAIVFITICIEACIDLDKLNVGETGIIYSENEKDIIPFAVDKELLEEWFNMEEANDYYGMKELINIGFKCRLTQILQNSCDNKGIVGIDSGTKILVLEGSSKEGVHVRILEGLLKNEDGYVPYKFCKKYKE